MPSIDPVNLAKNLMGSQESVQIYVVFFIWIKNNYGVVIEKEPEFSRYVNSPDEFDTQL